MSNVPTLTHESTLATIDFLMHAIPGGPLAMIRNLLDNENGRAAIKQVAKQLLPLVVEAHPVDAVKHVSELSEDVQGPSNYGEEFPLSTVPVGLQAVQLALGCDVHLVGFSIDCKHKENQVFDWFETFSFPTDEFLSNGQVGIMWHTLLTMIAEQGWHVQVREAWEAWVNNSNEQCAPFQLQLGDIVATACNHSHGCVVVHWCDLVNLVGGQHVLAQKATDIYTDMVDWDDMDTYDDSRHTPNPGCDTLAMLEDELLVDIAKHIDVDGNRFPSNNLISVSDRGERPEPTRPWLTIVYD